MNLDSHESQKPTLTDRVKDAARGILEPLAMLLLKVGAGPDFLTFIGFLLAVAAGTLATLGHFFQSGFVFALSGLCDALDGTLARVGKRTSRSGAFFDSFMDRYAESALFVGIICWSAFHSRQDLVLLAALALVGSFMVSYARARAEGLGMSCRVGLFSRMERFIVLVSALITHQLFFGLALLAVMANVTALQRMVHVIRQGRA